MSVRWLANREKARGLALPALGGIVGSAPNTAGGFVPVRRKNPANTEPNAPFRIVLRDRTLKPVNYNVDSFDPEDDVEDGHDRKRSRRADTSRAKPRAKHPSGDPDCEDDEEATAVKTAAAANSSELEELRAYASWNPDAFEEFRRKRKLADTILVDLDVNGKVIRRVAYHTRKGTKDDRCPKLDGTSQCARCGVIKTSKWYGTDEKICRQCYNRGKVRICRSHLRVPPPHFPLHRSSSRRLAMATSAPGAAPKTALTGTSPRGSCSATTARR
jgi:hypothetical protein